MAKSGSGQDILAGLLGATRAASSLGAQKTAARGEQNQALQEALRNLMLQKQQKTQEEQFAERQALDEAQLAQSKRNFELAQGAERQKIIEGYRTEGMLLYQQANPGAPLEDAMIYGSTVYAPAKITGKTPPVPPTQAPAQTFEGTTPSNFERGMGKIGEVVGTPVKAFEQAKEQPGIFGLGAQAFGQTQGPGMLLEAISQGKKIFGGSQKVPIEVPAGLIPLNRQAEVNPIFQGVATRDITAKQGKEAIYALRNLTPEQKVKIGDYLTQVEAKVLNPSAPEPKQKELPSSVTAGLLNTSPKGSVLGQATRPQSSKIPMPFTMPTLSPSAGNTAMTQRLMALKQNYSPEADRALDVEVKRAFANKELTPEEYRQVSGAMADARLINTLILAP